MKVKNLIKRLKKFDPEMEVFLRSLNNYRDVQVTYGVGVQSVGSDGASSPQDFMEAVVIVFKQPGRWVDEFGRRNPRVSDYNN